MFLWKRKSKKRAGLNQIIFDLLGLSRRGYVDVIRVHSIMRYNKGGGVAEVSRELFCFFNSYFNASGSKKSPLR